MPVLIARTDPLVDGRLRRASATPLLLHGEVVLFVAESWVTPLHHRCATAFSRGTGCSRSVLIAQIRAGIAGLIA